MKTNFCVLILIFLLKRCYAQKSFLDIPLFNFSAVYAFGDSTVDTGTNNYLHTTLKSNYYPYGINLPSKNASGRFSDGKVLPDIISSFLGIKELVPPFLDPKLSDEELLTGVNFGSSGSGFDDLTTVYSNGAPVSEQLFFFKHYLVRISRIVGEQRAKQIIRDSLVILSAGTYDWILNFYNSPQIRRMKYDFNGYANFLIQKTQEVVQQLYDHGCRTIVVAGLPPIGCLPIQLYVNPPEKKNPCVLNQNMDIFIYNRNLDEMLRNMRYKLGIKTIVYADVYTAMMDMHINPGRYGIKETMIGCCNQEGVYKETYMCNPTKPCQNPSEYLYWDNIHPTEAVTKLLSEFVKVEVLPYLL